jgi:hypothetical protein
MEKFFAQEDLESMSFAGLEALRKYLKRKIKLEHRFLEHYDENADIIDCKNNIKHLKSLISQIDYVENEMFDELTTKEENFI